MINQRIFSANVGDSSVGIAGPDAIEQDIDNLLANDQELLGTLNDHETQINDLATFRGVRLIMSANQSILANANTAINWDTAIYDTDDFFSLVNPTEIIIPTGVKKVRITANIFYLAQDTRMLRSAIYKNVANLENNIAHIQSGDGNSSGSMGNQLIQNLNSGVVEVEAGDKIMVYGFSRGVANDITSYSWVSLEVVEYDEN